MTGIKTELRKWSNELGDKVKGISRGIPKNTNGKHSNRFYTKEGKSSLKEWNKSSEGDSNETLMSK